MRKSLLIILITVGLFSGACLSTPEESAKPYLAECSNYISGGDLDLSIKACTKAIELDPNSQYAYLYRGYAHYLKGEYELALKDYSRCITAPGKEYKPDCYLNRAGLYTDMGKYDLAIMDYTTLFEEFNDYDALRGRGKVFLKKGEYDSAIRDFTDYIEHYSGRESLLNEPYWWSYFRRGEAYFEKGECDLAIKDFTKAMTYFSSLADVVGEHILEANAYMARGISYAIKGEYERARLDLKKALEGFKKAFEKAQASGQEKINSKIADTHYHLAFVLHKIGFEEEAKEELAKAKKLDPKIIQKAENLLLKPTARQNLRFYAKEYLFASHYLPTSEKYLARAKRILGIKEETPTTLVGLKIETVGKACVSSYPNRYLLAVLVSDYQRLSKLPFVKNDKKVLLKLATCFMGVPNGNILVLENPTMAEFRHQCREFLSSIKEQDAKVFFYYSGHGVADSRGRFYLMPRDAVVSNEMDLVETGISLDEVKRKLLFAKGVKLAIIDACRVKVPWKPAMLVTKVLPQRNLTLLFATTLGGLSATEKGERASAFLAALYQMASRGVENLDFDGSGYVELKELFKPLTVQIQKISVAGQKPQVVGATNIPLFPVK